MGASGTPILHEDESPRRGKSDKHLRVLPQSQNHQLGRWSRPSARRKHVKKSNPIQVDIDAADFPVASSAYVGIGDQGNRSVFALHDLVGSQGFRLVEWDRRSAFSSDIAMVYY